MSLGAPILRADAPRKLRGAAVYGADLRLPGLCHARLVTSPHAHALVRGVDGSAARRLPGVVAVIAGSEVRGGFMAAREATYVGHPVAAVVAADEAVACDAAELVRVDYEVLPAVLDPASGLDPASLGAGGDGGAGAHGGPAAGTAHEVRHRRGDVAAAFRRAHAVVEATFETPSVHQGYLEPQVCIARPEPDGGCTIWSSTQAPWIARDLAARALGVPAGRVRVVPLAVGGGFGGKFGLLEGVTAALAGRAGRPVRLLYDRGVEFLAGRPAPEAAVRLKLGARRDGRLVALESEALLDAGSGGGAPYGLVATVLAATYRVPNLDVRAREAFTHKRPTGAYRAPGVPQAYFALECQMEALARRLGLDPVEFRLRNAAREGDPLPDGRTWPRIGLVECLERLRAHPLWALARASREPGEGFGVAVGGWPGGLEPAAAACRLDADGALHVQVGSVDLTGSYTALAAIAAEAFGLSPDRVRVVFGDTDGAPFGGSAGGSKIVYTVGPAVRQAAADARRQTLEVAAALLEASEEDLVLEGGRVHVRGAPARGLDLEQVARECTRFGARFAPIHGHGRHVSPGPAPMFTAHLCRVRVDRDTGRVAVLDYVAAQDVGRAINPPEVIGQVRGGVAQGIGRALLERLAYDGSGQPLVGTLMDYLLPTAGDVPPVQVELVEVPAPFGPFGARGVGEPPVVPVMAAVANAVADATGSAPAALRAPLDPEAVLGWSAARR
jgi:CO/xanthine dehydrogenase Mo-binding subunit